MRLAIIEDNPEEKAALVGRVQEAARQAALENFEIVEVEKEKIDSFDWTVALGCLIGTGCYGEFDTLVERVRMAFSGGTLGIVLPAEIYQSQAVTFRKKLNVQTLSLGDIAQIAGFLIDCEDHAAAAGGGQTNHPVVGVCQVKGGVGTTTLTAALASCWARHGLSVAAIDLDDVSPELTSWARVGSTQRTVLAELLRTGEVPGNRINEIVHPVEGYEGRFVVVGQPESYNEGFHFKANVLEGVPSASEFMDGLVSHLKAEFDGVIIDMGRSWGVATFSTLRACDHVLLITDDDGMSVRMTLDALQRLRKESDDDSEFDFSKWSLVLNAHTGRLISPKDLATEIQEIEMFPADANLYTVPFSEMGRQWGAPGRSFYDLAEPRIRQTIRKIACNIIPFRYEPDTSLSSKLMKRWQSLVNAT